MKGTRYEIWVASIAAALILCWGLTVVMVAECSAKETKVVELVYNNGLAKTSILGGVVPQVWINRINAALKGRVRIRAVHGGALLTLPESLDGTIKGVAYMAQISTGYYVEKLPIAASFATILDVNLGTKIGVVGQGAITDQLMTEFSEMQSEFTKLGLVHLLTIPGCSYLMWCRTPVKAIEDLKGKRFRTYGSKMPIMVKAVGATPMSIDWGEIYTSLDTGLADIVFTDGEAGYPMKWHIPAPWVIRTWLQTGSVVNRIVMNAKSLNKLSPEDRETFLRITREMQPELSRIVNDKINKELWAKYEADGVTFREFPKGEMEKWAALYPDWYNETAKELDARGLPGTKMAARYKELAGDFISGKWKPRGY